MSWTARSERLKERSGKSLKRATKVVVNTVVVCAIVYYMLAGHRAMENTLALMNSKNEGYRRSLTKVDKSSMLLEVNN